MRRKRSGEAHGGHGDAAGAQTVFAHLVVHHVQGRGEVGEVEQRLADAHDHAARDHAQGTAAHVLLHDLVGFQVAHQAVLARGAERAAHGATHLGGDAQRGAASQGRGPGAGCAPSPRWRRAASRGRRTGAAWWSGRGRRRARAPARRAGALPGPGSRAGPGAAKSWPRSRARPVPAPPASRCGRGRADRRSAPPGTPVRRVHRRGTAAAEPVRPLPIRPPPSRPLPLRISRRRARLERLAQELGDLARHAACRLQGFRIGAADPSGGRRRRRPP
jgi:hypothetical protein